MSFGEGNLHERIDKLADTNGKLCAEINRQERVIEDLNNALAIEHRHFEVTRERWMKRGEEIARQRERIADLESLVRDMYKKLLDVPCGRDEIGEIIDRVAELGLEDE